MAEKKIEPDIWAKLPLKIQKELDYLHGFLVRGLKPEASLQFILQSNLSLRDKGTILSCSISKVRWLMQKKGAPTPEMLQRADALYKELSETALDDSLADDSVDTRPLYTDNDVRQLMADIRPLVDAAVDNVAQAKRLMTQKLRSVRDNAPTKAQLKRAERPAKHEMTPEEKAELRHKELNDPNYAYKPGEIVNYAALSVSEQADLNGGIDPRTNKPLTAAILAHYRLYPHALIEMLSPEQQELLKEATKDNGTEVDPERQKIADENKAKEIADTVKSHHDPDFAAELQRATEQWKPGDLQPKPGTRLQEQREWISYLPATSDAHTNMSNPEEVENNQMLDGMKYKGDDYIIKMDGGPWDEDLRAPEWCKTLTQKTRWYIRHRQWWDHTGPMGEQNLHTFRGWGDYGVRETRTDGLRYYPTFRFPTYRQARTYYQHAMEVDPDRPREIVQIDPTKDNAATPVHGAMPPIPIDPSMVPNAKPSEESQLA